MVEETLDFALRLENFGFTYPHTAAPVLNDVNLAVRPGEFLLLTGDTGSGKTTLLRLLKKELAPVGERSGVAEIAGNVGFVAQNPDTQIVCDSVWHELAFGLENAGVDPDEMRLRVAETAYFFGMEPWFHRSVQELSGGQKQLLNLASVIALRPDVLLLDEPTSQLDPLAQRDFAHALFRVNRELGCTVVVATHAPQLLARYATRQVHLKDGVIGETVKEEMTPAATPAPRQLSADVSSKKTASDLQFSLRDVHAAYDKSSAPILRGVDLEVTSGEIHALVGGNGCGKSTLLKVLAGTLRPYRGKVRREAGTQAYLPQDPRALFLADTVAEELALWQHSAAVPYTDEGVAAVLERFCLTDRTQVHPYDLSGGQQQLLALAKLWLVKPDVYLLDEPLKGLDAHARTLVLEVFAEEAARGATLVVATHDMAFVRDACNKVTFLFDGQVAATQTPSAFFAQNLLFAPFLADADEGRR